MPQATYYFRFSALNDVGLSQWAANLHTTMPRRSNPEEPSILNPVVPPNRYILSKTIQEHAAFCVVIENYLLFNTDDTYINNWILL